MSTQPGSKERNFYDEVAFTIGAEAADVINVGLQLQANGQDIAARATLLVYLSDDADGDGIAATAPSGGIAIGTDGAVLAELVADKLLFLQTDATGAVDVDITEVGADTWHLVACLPSGEIVASAAITFA